MLWLRSRLSSRAAAILTLTIGLGFAVLVFVAIEVRQNRRELLSTVEAEARTIAVVVTTSARHTLETSAAIDELLDQRLASAAALVARQERLSSTRRASWIDLLGQHDLSLLLIVDADGRPVVAEGRDSMPRFPSQELRELVRSMRDGEYLWMPTLLLDVAGEEYTAVVHARENAKGAVLCAVRSEEVTSLRRRLGIGRLLQNFGRNEDLVFLAIQDSLDILAGTPTPESLEDFANDPFLQTAARDTLPRSRIRTYREHPILEMVQGFPLDNETQAVVRIGLRLDHVRSLQQSAMIRTILLGAGIIVFTILLAVLSLTRTRFSSLERDHRRLSLTTERILDGMVEAVVATDGEGRILLANRAAQLLFPSLRTEANTLSPRSGNDVLPEGDPLRIEASRIAQSGIDFTEILVEPQPGRPVALGVSTSVVTDANGHPSLIVSIARDITVQRTLEERIQRESHLTAMGALAGEVAHEIRNPINAVGLIAQRLAREFLPHEGKEEYHSLLDTMRREIRRIDDIITQFLHKARPARVQRTPTDLALLLREALMLSTAQAESAGIRLSIDAPHSLIAEVDRDKIKQVLLNLLRNAIEAMPQGGTLHCGLQEDVHGVSLLVSDTGIGMSEDVRSRMFHLHFSTKPGGSGLGLGIVHHIITEHGGTITVESTPGIGTRVLVQFPHVPSPSAFGVS